MIDPRHAPIPLDRVGQPVAEKNPKMKPFPSLLLAGALLLPAAAPAAIVWTGAVDADIFNEANWDLSGSAVTVIDPNVTVNDDVVFQNATVSIPDVAAQQRFEVGSGFVVTVDNSSIIAAGNDGIAGPPGAHFPNLPLGPTINVVNGSQFEPFFIFQGTDLYVDGTSSINFRGGGNPVNVSRINLAAGATMTLNTAAEFVEHGQEIFIEGQQYVIKSGPNDASPVVTENTHLWDNLGATRVAVPEPGAAALLGLAGLALIFRRRK